MKNLKSKTVKPEKMAKNKKEETMEGEVVDNADEEYGEDGKKKEMLTEFKKVINQVEQEYQYGSRFMAPKWALWLVRFKLYNNQKKDKDAISDPLLFTIFQTVLASVYSDELVVSFTGVESGDDEQAENCTMLAKYDEEEMRKSEIDYDWLWNTGFFGRGLTIMMHWDDETHTPIPEVVDMLTWVRDPDATSVNGDRMGHGAMSFGGREIRLTTRQMKEAGIYQNLHLVCNSGEDNRYEATEINKAAKKLAQGFDSYRDKLTGDNESHLLLEWFTYFNGKKYLFTLAKERKVLIRAFEIKTKDWPILDRSLYPIAGDWDGVSIPDLVEDKQRGRAIIMNLAKKGVTAKLYPNYLYNNLLIKNKSQIAKFEFNKFTGVPGNPQGAVVPIERTNITTDVQWMLDMMDGASQKATATPDIQQGALTEKVKSATEIAKVSQGVDTRYSLAVKVLGWSERRFWRLWYELYYIYYKKHIYSKIARITGPFGPTRRVLKRDNIIGSADPDVKIESKKISDAKKMNKLNATMAFMNQAVAMDPNVNKRYGLKQLGAQMGMSTDELNHWLPKNYDEWEAEQENELLNKGKMPKVLAAQNHMVHIEMHAKANDSKEQYLHIEMHKVAMYAMQRNAALKPPAVPIDPNSPQGAQGGQPPSPMEQGLTPAPRDMAQSPLQLQAPNAVQQAA